VRRLGDEFVAAGLQRCQFGVNVGEHGGDGGLFVLERQTD
jgi:hypothetical protein